MEVPIAKQFEMVEALKLEYEKGKADAIAEMQKEWSEEDENKIDTIISVYRPSPKLVKWLKFLKERYAWKPSDEQIKAFEHFVRSIEESGYASPYENNTKLLYSLLNDLKKLKE